MTPTTCANGSRQGGSKPSSRQPLRVGHHILSTGVHTVEEMSSSASSAGSRTGDVSQPDMGQARTELPRRHRSRRRRLRVDPLSPQPRGGTVSARGQGFGIIAHHRHARPVFSARHPFRRAQQGSQALARRGDAERIGISIHPLGDVHPVERDTCCSQPFRCRARARSRSRS